MVEFGKIDKGLGSQPTTIPKDDSHHESEATVKDPTAQALEERNARIAALVASINTTGFEPASGPENSVHGAIRYAQAGAGVVRDLLRDRFVGLANERLNFRIAAHDVDADTGLATGFLRVRLNRSRTRNREILGKSLQNGTFFV